MRVRRVREEEGFTMIVVVMATFIVTALVIGALAAAQGDLHLTRNDLDHRKSYAAAQAGIDRYQFLLTRDTNYWATCQGITTKNVTSSTDESYAVTLLPATSQTACSTTSPATSMLEPSITGSTAPGGSFRLSSTGTSRNVTRTVVATLKRATFLDFLYFTQLETSDPVTYAASWQAGANTQCTKTFDQGRYSATIPGSSPATNCTRIDFISGDVINGPLHTNDSVNLCGSPVFGRTSADMIETTGIAPGWNDDCGGSSPNFKGTLKNAQQALVPPPTNGSLAAIASSAYHYYGLTKIVFNSTGTMSVNGGAAISLPASGVIYVSNSPTNACSNAYNPKSVTYPDDAGCGNAYVHGSVGAPVTIASENDIVVDGSLTVAKDGSGNLTGGPVGLIANNFVRIYHPCSGGNNGPGALSSPEIDAAILAIQHSFMVDNYNCGSPIGSLIVKGAIAQKFRGTVGTHSGSTVTTGYVKGYTYDDRLHYLSPPHFIDPVQSAWRVVRQTQNFP